MLRTKMKSNFAKTLSGISFLPHPNPTPRSIRTNFNLLRWVPTSCLAPKGLERKARLQLEPHTGVSLSLSPVST